MAEADLDGSAATYASRRLRRCHWTAGRRRTWRHALPAVRTPRIIRRNGPSALRAARHERTPALRTIAEAFSHSRSALRTLWAARHKQRLAQQEVRDKPDRLRDKDDQQRPQQRVHAAPLRIGIHVSDQQNEAGKKIPPTR